MSKHAAGKSAPHVTGITISAVVLCLEITHVELHAEHPEGKAEHNTVSAFLLTKPLQPRLWRSLGASQVLCTDMNDSGSSSESPRIHIGAHTKTLHKQTNRHTDFIFFPGGNCRLKR